MAIKKIERCATLHAAWSGQSGQNSGFADAYGKLLKETRSPYLTDLSEHSLLAFELRGGEILNIPSKHDRLPVASRAAGSWALSLADAKLVSLPKGTVRIPLHSFGDVLCELDGDGTTEPAVTLDVSLRDAAERLTIVSDTEVADYLDKVALPHELVDGALAEAAALDEVLRRTADAERIARQ